MTTMSGNVILHDAARQQWLDFREPVGEAAAYTLSEVLPALRAAEARVEAEGLHAAGFICYEAAPGFDPALRVRALEGRGEAAAGEGLPLLWFGLFRAPEVVAAPKPGPPVIQGEWTPSVSRDVYDAALAQIKDCIAAGRTYQVNYTFRLRRAFAGDPWALFSQLVHAQQPQYAAYVDLGRWVVCSASPELFFRREGQALTARPMKGTAPRGRTPAEDQAQAEWLRASEKNRAENVMIVDMLRNDLGRVAAIGSVRAPRLFEIERYPNVWQMTSTVTAESEAPLTDVMRALFPCASITGAPKASTMRLIARLETTPRRVYTGCIGTFGPGRAAQFNVAIRTVLLDRVAGQAEFGVGGGIVWDSETASEYDECVDKARVLTEPRPSFELLEALLWTPPGAAPVIGWPAGLDRPPLPVEDGYLLMEQHLARLRASAAYFGFAFDEASVRAALAKAAGRLPAQAHKVRLRLDPGGETRVEAEPAATPPPAAVRVGAAPAPVDSASRWLYHKTTQRQVYAAALAGCPGCDDVVLWNECGQATETCHGNLAARVGGEWVTPPLMAGLLPGVLRGWLLARGLVRERPLTLDEVRACSALYRVNSVRGWQKVIGNW
jgi:para-aminobenzoate synthetase/4-amino-4-deoxychorismate lyase